MLTRFRTSAVFAGSLGVASVPGLARAEPPPPASAPEPTGSAVPSAERAPLEPAPTAPPPNPGPEATRAAENVKANPFARGSKRLSLLLGTGSNVANEYLVLGAGLGYYFIDGAEIGLDYEVWFLGTPVMHRVSPELRYVFEMVPTVKPYVGAFYRHSFVNGLDDLDSIGGRLGAYFSPPHGRVYIGGGIAYDHVLACDSSGFIECDIIHPEIAIGASL